MARTHPLFLALALFGLAVTGCGVPSAENSPTDLPQGTASVVEHNAGRPKLSADFVSRIDGSTAAIPLGRAMLQLLRGTDDGMEFHQTIDAYDNLIDGSMDIIFVTAPSADELAAAADAGVELEVIPVVKDALVFLANTANPVDGLTQQQIKDIYTGNITNWAQLGGEDEPIIAYQRQQNSGSQTLFEQLAMGDAEPMDPPVGYSVEGMGELINHISAYDNSPQALGYSVFYYTQQMYVKDNVKLLTIDGVAPSTATIADGTYPYVTNYFAVLRKSEPANSTARQLVDWCLSDEGQQIFSAASYVPLDASNVVAPNSGYGYLGSTPQNTTQSSGTGGVPGSKATLKVQSDPCNNGACLSFDSDGNITGASIPKNPALEAAVDDWLASLDPADKHLDEHSTYNSDASRGLVTISIQVDVRVTATFRRSDGHRMQLSDYFYDGVNYIDFINRTLLNDGANQRFTPCPGSWYGCDAQIIAPFTGLPADFTDFEPTYDWTGLQFDFPAGNPFLSYAYGSSVGTSVPLNLPYDLSPYGITWQTNAVLVNGTSVQHVVSNYSSDNPHDAKINQTIDDWAVNQQAGGAVVTEVNIRNGVVLVDITWQNLFNAVKGRWATIDWATGELI